MPNTPGMSRFRAASRRLSQGPYPSNHGITSVAESRRTFSVGDTDSVLETGPESLFEVSVELLGHADVSTTMIYTHVLNRGALGVRSPADKL